MDLNCKTCDAPHQLISHSIVDGSIFCPLCDRQTKSLLHHNIGVFGDAFDSYQCIKCNNYVLHAFNNLIQEDELFIDYFLINRNIVEGTTIVSDISRFDKNVHHTKYYKLFYLPQIIEYKADFLQKIKTLILFS